MTFYTDMRDEVAAPLLAQFGRAATLRQEVVSYDPATGVGTATPTDTAVIVLEVNLERLLRSMSAQFSAELTASWDQGLIMSAKETAIAGVTPAVDDKLIIDGSTARIAWIGPLRPGGVAVIYKLAISRS